MAVPAGWYDDSRDPDQLRWWNGSKWEQRFMSKTTPVVAPATQSSNAHDMPTNSVVAATPILNPQQDAPKQTPASQPVGTSVYESTPSSLSSSALAAPARRLFDGLRSQLRTPVQAPVPAPTPTPTPAADAPYRFGGSGSWPSFDVVGESNYVGHIAAALDQKLRVGQEAEKLVEATIVPEPQNRFDRNAISVRIRGKVVGYFAKEEAVVYKAVINRIIANGYTPTTTARVWVSHQAGWGSNKSTLVASVRIALPEPYMLIPVNGPPEVPYSLIPWGSGLQVTGEDKHFDTLSPYVPREGRGLLLVTLHHIQEPRPHGKFIEFVEIRVDGDRVGQMTPASSKHFFPLMEHLAQYGLETAAWSTLKGSRVAADIVLQAAKATEVDDTWLYGAPVVVPPLN
jgi:hypothetical protein